MKSSAAKKKLTVRETILLTSMLFGMFFGAGNLIFPAKLGPDAGSNVVFAFLGMFVSAVGLPVLAVVAIAVSRTDGISTLSNRIGKRFSVVFSTALYLSIGPLISIPRCASVSFSVGAVRLLPESDSPLPLAVFSLLFFAAVLFFSLHPGNIITWIGKILNPVFLVVLSVLLITALTNPVGSPFEAVPTPEYVTPGKAFVSGFLDGYNTQDAIAGLAFGIIIINVILDFGVTKRKYVAKETAGAGVYCGVLMGIIYLLITVVAAQSYPILGSASDGGEVLGIISDHYFRTVGSVLMTAIVTIACLKTAIGLVTACSEAFTRIYPHGPSYRAWAVIFSICSFGIANFGLSTIVELCKPVLSFIYPLVIALILLALTEKLFLRKRVVYVTTIAFTAVPAFLDFLRALANLLPGGAAGLSDRITGFASSFLPLFDVGLGWVCPALAGFAIGIVVCLLRKRKPQLPPKEELPEPHSEKP